MEIADTVRPLSDPRLCMKASVLEQTCKKPLKGASPVPGPIMIIGTELSAGNLKFDCLTKIGAQLHSWLSSNGAAFCKNTKC